MFTVCSSDLPASEQVYKLSQWDDIFTTITTRVHFVQFVQFVLEGQIVTDRK